MCISVSESLNHRFTFLKNTLLLTQLRKFYAIGKLNIYTIIVRVLHVKILLHTRCHVNLLQCFLIVPKK